jgi:flagellar biosynthesis protein FlhF
MGMGQRDKRLAEQAAMFDAAGVQRLLLLNATSSGDTLEDVVRMYHGNGVIGCIATKLDEAVTLGGVLDVMVRHKLNLHYVANGQRVPEDLHEVNMAYLLHRAFETARKPDAFATQELDIPALMAGQSAQASAGGMHAA